MFWRTSENSCATFWGYDDILLKLYIDIAKSGEFTKLIKCGAASSQDCLEIWENLIKRQEKETGSNQYNAYFQLLKGYALLMADHMTIRVSLIEIALSSKVVPDGKVGMIWVPLYDVDDMLWLDRKGIKINTESHEKLIESVMIGLHKNENLVTKAEMKRKELERLFENRNEGESPGFIECIGRLNFQLGWSACDDKITLALFNQYQKELKAKYKAQEALNNKVNDRGNR